MVEINENDEEFTMEVREASPAHLLMKIESFSLVSKHEIESPEFEAGNCKWRLVIHGENNEDDHISVYLTIVETIWEATADFKIFLYNQVLDNYLCFQGKTRRFRGMKSKWGFSKLISKESLRAPDNGFLVDDNCVFGAEVTVIEAQRVTQCVSVKKFDSPYKREWKIPCFSKYGEVWYSEQFTVGDHNWYVALQSNGFPSGCQNAYMYLYLVGAPSFFSNKKVKADFYLRIKNQQLDDQYRSQHKSLWFSSSVPSWGWSTFIPLSNEPNIWPTVISYSDSRDFGNDWFIIEVEISVEAVVVA